MITTAVIPAAGMGTRMLPATKAVPKELLPVVERPALQLIVDEALGAGVDHLVVVTSRSKPAIEQYFATDVVVEDSLERQGRAALAASLRRFADDVRVSFVYQDEPRGLGHAIGCARSAVGDDPFFVMFPDELMSDSSLLSGLARVVSDTGVGAVALKRMPRAELFRYGIVSPVGDEREVCGLAALPFGEADGRGGTERPRHHRSLRVDPRHLRRPRRVDPRVHGRTPTHGRLGRPGRSPTLVGCRLRRGSHRHRKPDRLVARGGGNRTRPPRVG